MAYNQKECFGKLFQGHFPLVIVSSEKIPKAEDIISFRENEIDFYIKTAVNMQILCSVKNGYGLSAVQCGIPLKLFVTNDGTNQFRTFIDCDYVGNGEKAESLEGCLSLRLGSGSIRRFIVPRYKDIRVSGYEIFINSIDKKFAKIEDNFSGIPAIVLQHEIDHNNGILISDIGKEVEVF